MPLIRVPVPRYEQPQDAVEVDRGNLFGARLLFAFSGYPARQEIVSGTQSTGGSNQSLASIELNADGVCASTSVSSPNIYLAFLVERSLPAGEPFTLLARLQVKSIPASRRFIFQAGGFGTSGVSLEPTGVLRGTAGVAGTEVSSDSAVAAGQYVTVVYVAREGEQRLWIDGVLQTASGTASIGGSAAKNVAWLFASDVRLALGACFAGALSDTEIAQVSANPWQLFAPRRIWVPLAASGGGGDITLALTGQAVSASAGSIGNSRTRAVSGQAVSASAGALARGAAFGLSGQSVSTAAGSLGVARSIALSGAAANASAGSVFPSRTLGLSGQAVSALAGTVAYAINGDLTLALVGQSVAAQAGGFGFGLSKGISGAAATFAAGSVGYVVSRALEGVAVAASAGTITPSRTIALLGAEATAQAGSVIYATGNDIVLALSGQAVATYAGTLSIEPSVTSGAVFFVPLRMVSGLWSTAGVGASIPADKQAWLPSIRHPVAYVDPRDGKTYCDPIWYRAFEFVFETRLGGRLGPSIPDVVTTVTATQETAAAASATIAEVAQQAQANAEALFVVREVVQENALDGAAQIPGVDLR